MARRLTNHRLAKIHRCYTVKELSELFTVHENTVRRWRSQGLEPIDQTVPVMFKGGEVQRFLVSRHKDGKRPSPSGMVYCLPCRAHRHPAGEMADYIASNATSGNLRALCPVCDRLMHRAIRRDQISCSFPNVDVAFTEALPRLEECDHLPVKCDSEAGVRI